MSCPPRPRGPLSLFRQMITATGIQIACGPVALQRNLTAGGQRMTKPVAIVTGANGRIGQETVKALTTDGFIVVGVDIAEAPFVQGPYQKVDLANVELFPALIERISTSYGPIRALVNNAGIWQGTHYDRITPESFDQTFAINTRAPFFLTQSYAAYIEAIGGGGAVVNTSSLAAKSPSLVVDYSASKAALSCLTKGLARPLGKLGIRINAVAPIFIKSAMTDRVTPERMREMEDNAVLGRAGEAAEVAAVIAFLLSDKASYMTGTTVEVDGGG